MFGRFLSQIKSLWISSSSWHCSHRGYIDNFWKSKRFKDNNFTIKRQEAHTPNLNNLLKFFDTGNIILFMKLFRVIGEINPKNFDTVIGQRNIVDAWECCQNTPLYPNSGQFAFGHIDFHARKKRKIIKSVKDSCNRVKVRDKKGRVISISR